MTDRTEREALEAELRAVERQLRTLGRLAPKRIQLLTRQQQLTDQLRQMTAREAQERRERERREKLAQEKREQEKREQEKRGQDKDGGGTPDPRVGKDLPISAIGVLFPLRLETRFKAHQLWVRIVPDDAWLSRHDPRPTAAELAALKRYLAAAEDGRAAEGAWQRFAGVHGGGRATWLERTFGPDEHGSQPAIAADEVRADDDPRFPELRGFPDALEIWAARGGGPPERLATTTVHHDLLTIDLPIDRNADADAGSDSDALPDPEPRWWESFEIAEKAGLAARIDLGQRLDDLDVLYVVGLGDGPPGDLLSDHRDAGMLGTIAAGTPTASVDGVPAADRDPDPATWWDLREATSATRAPHEDARRERQRRLSAALTGDPDRLGPLPGGSGIAPNPLVAGLWPALWGHGLRDVLGVGPAVDDLAGWAAENVAPQGHLPTLRIGRQPYGVLAATDLSSWRSAPREPALEPALITVLAGLREVWADAAESRGNVEGADADRLLDLLAHQPTSPAYRHRLAWPLESWFLGAWLLGSGRSWRALTDRWDAANPLAAELGLAPRRRYASRGWSQPLELPLVAAAGTAPQEVQKQLARLVAHARSDPADFASPDTLINTVLKAPADSLLLRLALRSLQLALADVGRQLAGDPEEALEPVAGPVGSRVRLDAWIEQLDPAALGGDSAAAVAFTRVVEALEHVAASDGEHLEGALRATIDSASYRIDPWVSAPAWRRLQDTLAAGTPERPPLRLGAFGWVDRPRPGGGTPIDGDQGLVFAPSDAQVTAAAILRDRAVNGDEPQRWQMGVESSSARAAARLAERIGAGGNPSEVLGAEVERIVGSSERVDRLRRVFPIRPDHAGRRVCDGLAVLADGLTDHDLDARVHRELQALRAAVDVYGDLLVAESVFDVVEGRPEMAAAAMDAAAGLARPPNLEVLRTHRQGRAVGSSALSVLRDVPTPKDAGTALASPGAVADPAVADLLVEVFGDGASWTWELDGPERRWTDTVTLATLELEPIDALASPLADLEGRVRTVAGDGDGAIVGGTAAARYAGSRALVASLGRPARRGHLAEDAAADAVGDGELLADLRDRLAALRAGATALAEALEVAAGSGGSIRAPLRAAARWGIVVPDDAPDAAARAATRLRARRERTPDGGAAQALDADGLVAAIGDLASRTGQLAVLSRLPRSALPARLEPDDDLDVTWLPVVAAVREPLARREAVQLGGPDGVAPLRPWTNRPGDPWQTEGDPGQTEHDERRLIVAHAPTSLRLDEQDAPELLAVGLVDRWTETIPDERHTSAAAFGFDAPASRAPQSILLAVPPVPGTDLDGATLVRILAETRQLARARVALPRDLDAVAALVPTALLPARGPTAPTDT